ncbi:hypothetical protein NX059_009823 [Plenodomus lindquistii]|nr:hypothetical protein NX059_009823 [Plenodomus lindquistii]
MILYRFRLNSPNIYALTPPAAAEQVIQVEYRPPHINMSLQHVSGQPDDFIDSFQQLSLSGHRNQGSDAPLWVLPQRSWSWADFLNRGERWESLDPSWARDRDSDGNTLLIAAAAFGNHSWVTRLISQGANVNAKNFIGRTALMEAALWGRLSIVQFLIASQADIDLTDEEENRAFNLAKPVKLNSYERYERGKEEQIVERPWLDEQHRMKILELLSPGEGIIVANKAAEARINYAFFDQSLDGKYTNLVLKYFPTRPDPERRPKTVARIVDGSVAIDAMSGWAHDDQHAIPGSSMWEVLEFARKHMFEFPPHEHDKCDVQGGRDGNYQTQQPVKGSYYASHAEPQAVVHYLEVKQIRLDMGGAYRRSTAVAGNTSSAIRDVQVLVSNSVCPVCMEFMSHVNSITRRSANLQFVPWERFVAANGELVARKAEPVVRGSF